MIHHLFNLLYAFENVLWGYVGVPIIVCLGLYLSFSSRFVQIRHFHLVFKTLYDLMRQPRKCKTEVHPLRAFFACVAGNVGIGNVVAICTAVQLGGPGALFWIWITALLGMMLKYSEVYLGMRYRVKNGRGGYNGGPMYFLQRVFKTAWVPSIVSILLCIYGVEIYQFSVITSCIAHNFELNHFSVIILLLALVLFACSGGVNRVGKISSGIIPLFVIVYVAMSIWVLGHNLSILPTILYDVFYSAFSEQAAVGGFAGSTMMLAMSQGVRRSCYTGDLGVGYASVIHSESFIKVPEKQACLAILDIFLDSYVISTTSIMLILVTGVWKESMDAGMLVQSALGQYFPYMNYFMPLFLFLLGYSTINTYFCVGLKCAEFLHPKIGRSIYFIYAALSLLLFSFVDTAQAQTVMTIAGGILLIFNCYGIFRMRKEISFDFAGSQEYESDASVSPSTAQQPQKPLVDSLA